MTFLRQIALLLPSAFLLGALLFLLTHGRGDAGFGVYPALESWGGGALAGATPELRFLAQAAILFLPPYLLALLLVLGVSLGERGALGSRQERRRSAFTRSFTALFSPLFLLATAALVFFGDRAAARAAPGVLLAPALVALAPFVGGAAALAPAAVLALPLAAIKRAAGA
ncbi:MAG TPA: hypothetical protein VIA45_16445 [Thermoanaerobaculia bacterium]